MGGQTLASVLPHFLTEKRLEAGLSFWQQHEQTIARAAKTYGVDPQIIVAIIGIETFYGGYMGKYPVIDASIPWDSTTRHGRLSFAANLPS